MTPETKIRLLKKVDQVVGALLVKFLPKTVISTREIDIAPKILIIRPGGIGDAVMLVPVLQAVKVKYPGANIDVLAEKRNAAIFGLCTVVDRVLLYDQGGMLTALRSRYDVVIDAEQWHRLTAVVSRLIRSRLKIGYGTNERKKLFTHPVEYSHERYELDSFFDLLQPFGVHRPEATPIPFLTVSAEEKQVPKQLLEPLASRPFIVLFPGASIAERRWAGGKFNQLALQLNKHGYPVVVIGGKEDLLTGETIVAGVDGLNLAGKTSLVGSVAVIEQASLLVSGDSGMLHVAVGLGRPTVSLFGSGIAAKWAPRGDRHVVLNKGLPCSPCTKFGYTPPCPINTKCLTDISVDEVYPAVMHLVSQMSRKEPI